MIDFSQIPDTLLERLVIEPDMIVKNHIYIFTKTFDVYICWSGRITVAEKTLCKGTDTGNLYFFNSKNTLPHDAAVMLRKNPAEHLLDITNLYNYIKEKEEPSELQKYSSNKH